MCGINDWVEGMIYTNFRQAALALETYSCSRKDSSIKGVIEVKIRPESPQVGQGYRRAFGMASSKRGM